MPECGDLSSGRAEHRAGTARQLNGLSVQQRVSSGLQIPNVKLAAAHADLIVRERSAIVRHAQVSDDAHAAGQATEWTMGLASGRVNRNRP